MGLEDKAAYWERRARKAERALGETQQRLLVSERARPFYMSSLHDGARDIKPTIPPPHSLPHGLVLQPFSLTVRTVQVEDPRRHAVCVHPRAKDFRHVTVTASVVRRGTREWIELYDQRLLPCASRERFYHGFRQQLLKMAEHEIDECLTDEQGDLIRDPHANDR